jgi:hypothetical protein
MSEENYFEYSRWIFNVVFPLGQVEPVQVHDLIPRRYKVLYELLRGIFTGIDFC